MSACNARPCLNGGICVDITNNNGSLLDGIFLVNPADFTCVCPTALQPACHSSPCLHGGTCIDSSNTADVAFNYNGFKCLCPTGFLGSNCEVTEKDSPETYQAFEGSRIAALASHGIPGEAITQIPYVTDNAGNAIIHNELSPKVSIKVKTHPSSSPVLVVSGPPGPGSPVSPPPPSGLTIPEIQPPVTQNSDGGNTRGNVPATTPDVRYSLLNVFKNARYNPRYANSYTGYDSYTGQARGSLSAFQSPSPYTSGGYTGNNSPYTRGQQWYPYGQQQAYYPTPPTQNTGYQYNWGQPPYSAYIHSKDENHLQTSYHRHFKRDSEKTHNNKDNKKTN